MAGIPDYSTTAASNTTVGGISIAEGWAPSSVNNAIRAVMADLATMTQGGTKVAEVTVASAATCNILGAASDLIAISGTTTITSLGTGASRLKFVRFTGALILTHNATSLILPGAANITTAAGDCMIVESDPSSNARVLAYQPADGAPITLAARNVTALTADASPDTAADYLVTYDASAGTLKKVLLSNVIPTSSTIPVGTVADYAGTSAPSLWLFCYGQNVSRTTYSALFSAISTTYGVGDGSTTFGLPDLRGRVIAGKDDMGGTSANRLTNLSGGLDGDVLGTSGGSETHTLTTAQLASHTHTWAIGTSSTGSSTTVPAGGLNPNVTPNTGSAGSGNAHNNVQPTFILNKIIYAGV